MLVEHLERSDSQGVFYFLKEVQVRILVLIFDWCHLAHLCTGPPFGSRVFFGLSLVFGLKTSKELDFTVLYMLPRIDKFPTSGVERLPNRANVSKFLLQTKQIDRYLLVRLGLLVKLCYLQLDVVGILVPKVVLRDDWDEAVLEYSLLQPILAQIIIVFLDYLLLEVVNHHLPESVLPALVKLTSAQPILVYLQ